MRTCQRRKARNVPVLVPALAEGEAFIARVKADHVEYRKRRLANIERSDISSKSTVDDLVRFLEEEISGENDPVQIVRVLTTETDAWPRNAASLEMLAGSRTRPISARTPDSLRFLHRGVIFDHIDLRVV